MGQDNPGKMFYRVGEVSQLAGVESYVLRYWEKMFPQLKPEKDENGQRIYTKSDIGVVLYIKELLYEERYTIDGARKRLRGEGKDKGAEDTQRLLTVLRAVKSTLQEVSAILKDE
jgi:DNA-binding transcriptional MerR regulator